MDNIWIIAQADGDMLGEDLNNQTEEQTGIIQESGQENGTDDIRPKGFFDNYGSLAILFVMFALMYVVLLRGPKKRQQEHKQMVQALAKNDKVRTIGGIMGTVVDIKGDEITLKIDESNNTKIKILASAISGKIAKD